MKPYFNIVIVCSNKAPGWVEFNKIQVLIQKGIDEGAKLVAGGPGKPDGLNDGYLILL